VGGHDCVVGVTAGSLVVAQYFGGGPDEEGLFIGELFWRRDEPDSVQAPKSLLPCWSCLDFFSVSLLGLCCCLVSTPPNCGLKTSHARP